PANRPGLAERGYQRARRRGPADGRLRPPHGRLRRGSPSRRIVAVKRMLNLDRDAAVAGLKGLAAGVRYLIDGVDRARRPEPWRWPARFLRAWSNDSFDGPDPRLIRSGASRGSTLPQTQTIQYLERVETQSCHYES